MSTTAHAPSPIRTLLIANRGEIARRIIRSAREMGIRTVAVFADPDRLAPHVFEADVAVPLGGVTPADTYLNRDALLKAAEWQGADAIHPGYGFLSENASFARAVLAAGHTWVGPSPEAMSAMADKIQAKRTAEDAHVPTLPSAVLSGDDPKRWLADVEAVGFPLLVKAAAGGGGKGMRLVRGADELAEAVRAARREAHAGFGDQTVFAERWLDQPRHIEIQVFADHDGTVVHLGERECSIQRRHQKLVEEAPSPAVTPALRARLGEAAVDLAEAINYVNAGTVEFLLDDRGSFHFLEMNTRLQVEHPVTEAVTGLDLVRLQLHVAGGGALGFSQEDVQLRGHAVEVRLYAEEPDRGWLPSVGRIHRWRPGSTPGVRYDDGVADGSEVTTHYDPLLSKVIVHAPSRTEAAARLARSLRELQIHGVTTNRDYLVEVLGEPGFLAGDTRTDFVERHPPSGAESAQITAFERHWQRFNTVLGPHLAAAALYDQRQSAWRAGTWPFAPSGWRNVNGRGKELRPAEGAWRLSDSEVGSAPQLVAFRTRGEVWEVEYARAGRDHPLAVRRRREGGPGEPIELFNVAINGPIGSSTTLVELLDRGDGELLVHYGRRGHHCTVHVVDDHYYVNSPLGQSNLELIPRFHGHQTEAGGSGPVAPVPGRIASVAVDAGDQVEPGQVLVTLEAMKVEHAVRAVTAGVVVEVLVAPGDNVDAHQLLVRLEEVSDGS